MYQWSSSIGEFKVAGVKNYDACFVINDMKVGDKLQLVSEPDNPADPYAVALYYDDKKIGYIPQECNGTIAQLLYFGHNDVLEAVLLKVDPERDPWDQLFISVRIKDMRGEK